MPPLKVVLDTNVYIQSLMRPGSFLDVLIRRSAGLRLAKFYTTEEILLELRRKAEERFGFSPTESSQLLGLCRELCSVVEPLERLKVIKRDPDDDKILECAIAAHADVIISADRDLIKLKEFRGIKIVHPSTLKHLFPQIS